MRRDDSTDAFPKLPGYVSQRVTPGQNVAKPGGLQWVNGVPMSLSDPAPAVGRPKPSILAQQLGEMTYADVDRGRYSQFAQRRDREENGPLLPFSNEEQLPRFIAQDKQILSFGAFFKEAVHESALENFRVRKVDIRYYLEDDTLQITERKVTNSGLQQGCFAKRHRVPKANGQGFVMLDDIRVGADLTIYSRTFRVVDCDEYTRRHLVEACGRPEPRFEGFPPDASDSEPPVPHRMRIDGTFRGTQAPRITRDQFLENDRKVLRYFAVWDDRGRLNGSLQRFVIHYFVADDTMEVCEKIENNSGKDPFPRLLSRRRVPKQYDVTRTAEAENEAEAWHWTEIGIGTEITVFTRQLRIQDADNFTRSFYREQGRPLGPSQVIEEPRKPPPRAKTPPHNGFGTPEDSIGSCNSLVPKAPKRNLKKMQEMHGHMLRFSAQFVECKQDDEIRRFIVTYFLEDDTIAIMEPPIRNSGIVGGKFLKRGRYAKRSAGNGPDGSFQPSDFYAGAELRIFRYIFKLIDVDEQSLHFMEKRVWQFPMADPARILSLVARGLGERGREGLFDVLGEDTVTFEDLQQRFIDSGCYPGMVAQEAITLMRKFPADDPAAAAGEGEPRMSVAALADELYG